MAPGIAANVRRVRKLLCDPRILMLSSMLFVGMLLADVRLAFTLHYDITDLAPTKGRQGFFLVWFSLVFDCTFTQFCLPCPLQKFCLWMTDVSLTVS
jgi:hypothetical protein